MKKAIKKYLTQLHENEEKGFSLVELIIVMAIMAILVGVVASQVIPYMEKSRQSKDQQQISSLATDITAALASSGQSAQNVNGGSATTGKEIKNGSGIVDMGTDATAGGLIVNELLTLRNDATDVDAVITAIKGKLKSKAATDTSKSDGKIYMIYDTATSKLTLFMGPDSDKNNAIAKLTVESE